MHEMDDLYEIVIYQDWHHLLASSIPDIDKKEVREFYHEMTFRTGGMEFRTTVNGVEITVEEKTLGQILEVPTEEIRTEKRTIIGITDLYLMKALSTFQAISQPAIMIENMHKVMMVKDGKHSLANGFILKRMFDFFKVLYGREL
ncbi:hypothetical protein HAX54_015789 [Datura stramonium]|uniref:Uncharacterized protein n=1 Tax=Datura stramonium TaxID=4076 RepID=A0ABS8UJN0_DATST|nr:hypothetical protein [Datura stramonium]